MVSVQGTSDKLQEPLTPLQHGVLDPDEGYPFKEKNNHKHTIFLCILFFVTLKELGKIVRNGLVYRTKCSKNHNLTVKL